jgi:hypothetical protein
MVLPEEDRNPYRHAYGDYTHRSANGAYTFEWTPFTPAVKAWENARACLEQAVKDLAEARRLPGFGLNGLTDEHAELIGVLTVLIEDTEACHKEASTLVEVLRTANTEYARANEASREQYQALTKVIDRIAVLQRSTRAVSETRQNTLDTVQNWGPPFDGKE